MLGLVILGELGYQRREKVEQRGEVEIDESAVRSSEGGYYWLY